MCANCELRAGNCQLKMGEVFLNTVTHELIIRSVLIFYGTAAGADLAAEAAEEVETMWNEPAARVYINGASWRVRFAINGEYIPEITVDAIHQNLDARLNFFRVEEFSRLHISFVDEIGCNTGYFKRDNLVNGSTTAAHEFGHTIGLDHPAMLDIRGKGQPGIMYPRGTLVDAPYQWDPEAAAGQPGGTLNPAYRKVLQGDIENLHLEQLSFSVDGMASLGAFTNLYHSKH